MTNTAKQMTNVIINTFIFFMFVNTFNQSVNQSIFFIIPNRKLLCSTVGKRNNHSDIMYVCIARDRRILRYLKLLLEANLSSSFPMESEMEEVNFFC